MAEVEENFLIIDCETTKHVFFHSPVTKSSSLTLVSNLLGIEHELIKYKGGFGFAEGDNVPEPVRDPRIVLHINSPGGLISSAFMIADTISNMTIPVDCVVDELAASAAVIIFLASENRSMLDHAELVFHESIHGVDNVSFSDISDFAKGAKGIYDSMVDYYVDKLGMKPRDIRKLMKDNTTLSKAEAIKLGFVTSGLPEVSAS